jgi:arylsulfatase A-like enzyme
MRPAQTIRTALATTALFGVVQIFIETCAIAALHGSLLLQPRTFFNFRIYDAFAKLYAGIEGFLGLPTWMNAFTGPGVWAKTAIGGPLLAVDALPALIVGTGAGLALSFTSSRNAELPASTGIRTLALVSGVSGAIHTVDWVRSVDLPVDPTAFEILRNFARNFIHDGTLVAMCVLAVSTVATFVLLRSATARGWTAIAAAGAVVLAANSLLTGNGPYSSKAEAPPSAASAPVADGYNVILISIDSLRSDHLGAYGYKRDTSPTIDALAAAGVMFAKNSSTSAWTLPAHMSLITGRSLLGHGVISDDRALSDDVPTLAESLGSNGYTTAAIVSAPYVESRYGFDRGFDLYDDQTINFATHGDSYTEVTAPRLQAAADEWLSANGDRKFFLFLHYWDVHYDYTPPAPYDTMFDPDYDGEMDGTNFYFRDDVHADMEGRDLEYILALYDGEIRLVDDALRDLRRSLDRLGIADKTVFVVTSDHGDEFFEHGRKGHHRTLYEEIVRVPLIVHVPGKSAKTPVVEMETTIADIMPTILGLTGTPVPEGVEGEDLSAIAYGDRPQWNRRTLAELYRNDSMNAQVAYRDADRKLIHHLNDRKAELFDTNEDPDETSPIAADRGPDSLLAGLADEMNENWEIFSGRIRAQGVNTLRMDAETEEKLRALGYIE